MKENKKKKTSAKHRKIDKAPSIYERITDFSVGGHSKPVFIPKSEIGKPPTPEERITDFSRDSFVEEPIWTPKRKMKK